MKLLPWVGTLEELEKARLYAESDPETVNGDVCGLLYRATIKRPRLNMSAEATSELSKTKSGLV
jgi:hypothetical protein